MLHPVTKRSNRLQAPGLHRKTQPQNNQIFWQKGALQNEAFRFPKFLTCRDLISSADTILEMSSLCSNVVTNISSLKVEPSLPTSQESPL